MFGYYTLASVVAMSLTRFISPVFTGIYPRFTQLASLNDQERLKQLYNKSSQLMSVLILPVAIVIAFFSFEILLLWSQNPLIAEKTHLLVSIMICGTALNGLMNLPYALQLAFGWTRIGLHIITFLLIIFIPTIVVLTKFLGPIGAAIAWLALNIIYMAIGVPLTHRRLLKGEAKKWCYNILFPVAGILATVLTGRYLFKSFLSPTNAIIPISTIYLCAMFSAVIVSEHIRGLINFKILRGKTIC
jgi:O-antigen/teichoic acid export membrane protein